MKIRRCLFEWVMCFGLVLASQLLWGQSPAIDCPGTVQAWNSDPHIPAQYKNCKCPCDTCQPQCGGSYSAPAAPWSGGNVTHATSTQMFAAQMVGNMIGQLIASAFAPPQVDEAAIEAQRQQEEEARKKAEEEKQRFLAAWKAKQAQAAEDHADAQAQKQQAGGDLLAHMQGLDGAQASSQPLTVEPAAGAFGTLQFMPVGKASAELKPMSSAKYETSGLPSWKRALCAAYLSQSALSVVKNDPEQARYFNDQAALAMSGQPIEVQCKFPKIQESPQPAGESAAMKKTMKAIELVQARAKDLQVIETKLQKIRTEKDDTEAKQKQAEDTLAQAEAQKAQAKPDDAALMAEIQRKLSEAQCQLDDANHKLGTLTQETEELYQQKETIRQELQTVQQQVQRDGSGSQQH